MEQLEGFHQSGYKFSNEERATRKYYAKRAADGVKQECACILQRCIRALTCFTFREVGSVKPPTLVPEMFADDPVSSSTTSIPAFPSSPISPHRIRCKMCRSGLFI